MPNEPSTPATTPALLQRSASSDAVSQRPPPTPTDLATGQEADTAELETHDTSPDIVDPTAPVHKPENHEQEKETFPEPEDGQSIADVSDQLGGGTHEATPVEGESKLGDLVPNSKSSPEKDVNDQADTSASTMDESFSEPVQFPTLDQAPNASDRSANRISISYANSTRRLVIDADVVKKVRILRAKARVEITLSVEVIREKNVEGDEKAVEGSEKKVEGDDKVLTLGEYDRFRGILVSLISYLDCVGTIFYALHKGRGV